MKVYSIFDDFGEKPAEILRNARVDLTIHPMGVPRPNELEMKHILQEHDCVIIGTSQKINEEMFENIESPRVIATASVGMDHIRIPEAKKALVTIINTPTANAQSVAEFTIGCALACCKRLEEGKSLYLQGKNNKALYQKPEDLAGKTMSVIGAGNISSHIMDYAALFGMKLLCYTAHPEKHQELKEKGVQFVSLTEACERADFLSVNLPNNQGTKGLISADLVSVMKDTAVFISVSRLATVDVKALIQKAESTPNFYVCLDIDPDNDLVGRLQQRYNIMITPHIAGGTVETRKRMFEELAVSIVKLL